MDQADSTRRLPHARGTPDNSLGCGVCKDTHVAALNLFPHTRYPAALSP